MDRYRRNFLVGLSGAAAAGAGGWILRDVDEVPPQKRSRGPSSPERPDVTDHGAVGDGVADDTAAVEAAIVTALGEAGSLRGGRILFPRGVYRITRTVTIEQAAAVVEGVGSGSVLAWDGPRDVPMLRLDYCQGTSISGLRFVGKSTSRPSAAISIRTLEGHSHGSNFNTLSSIWIGPTGSEDADSSSHQFDTGVLIEGDDVDAGSNRFEMMSIRGCTTGVRITRSRFRRNAFLGLQIGGCDVGFESNAGISNSGANWVFDESALSDIALGPGARLKVRGLAGRRSARLAVTESSSLMIRDGSWEVGPRLASDGIVISGRNATGRCFLRLEDLDITSNRASVPARIAWEPPSQVFLHNYSGPANTP
jgi:hypothetical protein